MSFGFDMAIEGADALNGLAVRLRNLPIYLAEGVHIAALKKAAEPLRRRIEVTAPEDTGLMVEDLRIAKSKFKKIGEYQVVVGFAKKAGRHGYLAAFHEFGTDKMPAKPFMRPADEKTKVQQENIYVQEIQKQVDKRLGNA